jgi:hypothetical protein
MSFAPPRNKNTFNIVRQVNVDNAALEKIADALGIPKAEHGRIASISGEIHISPPPTPAASGTTAQGGYGSPGSSSGGASPSSGTTGTGC